MPQLRPLITRSEIELQVRTHFSRQIDACEDLLAVAWQMLGAQPWPGRPMNDSPADSLIASEAARGLKTYRAALDAALGGFGPQAAMLDRTLFEGMAVAYWVRANPKLAGERFAQHTRHLRGIWKKRLDAQGWTEQLEDVPDAEEQRQLDKLFGPWGDRLWCGLPMHELIAAIEDQWEEGDRREELRAFFRIAHANNVETMHTTAMSLSGGVIVNSSTDFEVDAGPSLYQVDRGLAGAFWPLAHLLKVAAEHFEIDGHGGIQDAFLRCRAAFISLDPSLVRETGRNDPCPCGSTKKFKHCHGA